MHDLLVFAVCYATGVLSALVLMDAYVKPTTVRHYEEV